MACSISQSILVVGGGLAGLAAAYRLHRAGLEFTMIEARERLGGRIFTAGPAGEVSNDGFDLGPSWLWPDMHPAVRRFADELGLAFFPQHADGAMLFQRSQEVEPERYRVLRQEPPSMRLVGGSGSIISALAARLPQGRIRLGARAISTVRTIKGVMVRFQVADGSFEDLETGHVIFAMPPRLLAETMEFDPAPDGSCQRLWRDTPTWMAPHAKFFALYDTPFWRPAGLSGAAQSMTGPLVEIHDATTASGKAAIFGFVGVPAQYRRQGGGKAIINAAVAQLGQLFGPEALTPVTTLYKDWAADSSTATSLDQIGTGHPAGGKREWVDRNWRDWITLAGSETAAHDPGYLAGAIEAGERAAVRLIDRQIDKSVLPTAFGQ